MPKKKQGKKSREELHQEEAADKLSKLVHISTKSLRKEAKAVKAFQCQKIVRKIKELKHVSISSGANEVDEKMQQKMQALDENLKTIKEFDLDYIVQAALRRLGLSGDSESNKTLANDGDKYTKDTIEAMIKHKKLAAAMNAASEKVSEYNAWLSRREDWLAAKKGQRNHSNHESDNAQKRVKKRGRVDVAGHDGNSGLFIESLCGTAMPKQDEPGLAGYEGFGEYEEEEYYEMPKKKNRMGQRQRKAKAMAIEAKKVGRYLDSSLNWREKKYKSTDQDEYENQKEESASGLDKSKEVKAAEVASMGKNWKKEGNAHPSWAAREAQKAKSGIVAFAGKKITFD